MISSPWSRSSSDPEAPSAEALAADTKDLAEALCRACDHRSHVVAMAALGLALASVIESLPPGKREIALQSVATLWSERFGISASSARKPWWRWWRP